MHNNQDKNQDLDNEYDRLVNQFRNGDAPKPKVSAKARRSTEITFLYHIRNNKPAMRIGETTLINKGEILSVIGAPASGKSNLVEDLVAGFVSHITNTPYPHSLVGLTYEIANSYSRMLVLDQERPCDDVARSVSRTFRRINMNEDLLENDRFYNVTIFSQIELETVEERRNDILQLLTEAVEKGEPFEYLIIDGCLDMTTDMNNSKEAADAVRWIRQITSEFNLATVCTLHPNKNSETAAGHFGSYLHRWSRAFLLIKTVSQSDGLRTLTSAFDLGKLSHSSTMVERYFRWDTEKNFFVTVDAPTPVKPNSNPRLEKLMKKIFVKQMTTQIASMEFKKLVLDFSGESESKVKRMISEAVEFGYIYLSGDRKLAVYHLADHLADSLL